MGVPRGVNSQPPCASKLYGHLPKYKLWRNGGEGFFLLISFAAYLWNRILCPPGLGLPCVGWYRVYLKKNKKTKASLPHPYLTKVVLLSS